MAGKRFKASIEAFTKKDIKPNLTACFSSNRVLYWLRRSMTFCILTSLKVVNMAAFCCACNKRSATFALKRVMGTRCSGRRPAAITVASTGFAVSVFISITGLETGGLVSVLIGAGVGLLRCSRTSALVSRPLFPVPVIAEGFRVFSWIKRRTEGLNGISSSLCSGVLWTIIVGSEAGLA